MGTVVARSLSIVISVRQSLKRKGKSKKKKKNKKKKEESENGTPVLGVFPSRVVFPKGSHQPKSILRRSGKKSAEKRKPTNQKLRTCDHP